MIHLSKTRTTSFNDLVFDHRNQTYGAYVIRREYPVNVLKSFLIGIAIIATILMIPYLTTLLRKNTVMRNTTKQVTVCTLDVLPPKIKPPDIIRRKIKPPSNNSEQLRPPVIVDIVLDSLPEKIQNDSLIQGPEKGDSILGVNKGNGNNIKVIEVGKDTTTHPSFGLDRNPEFPGGEKALQRFLGANLVYPEYAKSVGIEGRVYVTFVVDEKGNVVNIKVPREIGGGCDQEAIRVIELMPQWDPGIFDGHPVRVYYQIPIIFKLGY